MYTIHPLTLRHNFSWTFLSNVVYAICQWAMLVILAKLGTPEMVGQFTMGLAITAPVMLLSNLQLRAIQVTDTQGDYQFSDYLALRLVTTILAFIVIAGITFTSGYQGETSLIIVIIALAKAIESISDIFYGFLQQQERMDYVAISMIFRGVLSTIALASAVFLTQSVVYGAMGLAATWVIVLILYDLPNVRLMQGLSESRWFPRSLRPQLKYPVHTLKTILKLSWVSLPLGLVMMLISLNTNVPRYFIENYLGQRELGIFAAMAYLQVAGTTVTSALGQSTSHQFAQYYASGNGPAFQKLLFKLVTIAAALGGMGILAACLAGRPILIWLYRVEYAAQVHVFVLLMVGGAVMYIVNCLGVAVTAMHQFKAQTVIHAVNFGLVLLFSPYLISHFHLTGAAFMMLASAVFLVCLYSFLIYQGSRNQMKNQKI